jgi:putative acetyltransferase
MSTPRFAEPSDAPGVRRLLAAVWGRSSEAGLVERLAQRADTFELVVTDGADVVGHAAIAPVELLRRRDAPASKPALCLALLGVAPESRRRGIGGALVRAAIEEARRRGAGLLVVIGQPRFYGRLGFVDAVELGLRCRWRTPPGHYRLVELAPGEVAAAARARAVVRFLPEFSA